MIFDKRSLVLFFSNAILLHLMLLINSGITGFGLNLFILGPAFIIAPLYLRADQFFLTTLFSGFWIDSALPIPFGTITLLMLLSGSIMHLTRRRFRVEKNFHPSLLAQLINLVAGLTLFLVSYNCGFGDFYTMLPLSIFEAILSHLILIFLSPWFFNFQRALFILFSAKKDPESLPFV